MQTLPKLRTNSGNEEVLSSNRASHAVLRTFNSSSSGEKAVKVMLQQELLGDGSAAELAMFLLANEGKLDPSMVGDLLGSKNEMCEEALRLVLRGLAARFGSAPDDLVY